MSEDDPETNFSFYNLRGYKAYFRQPRLLLSRKTVMSHNAAFQCINNQTLLIYGGRNRPPHGRYKPMGNETGIHVLHAHARKNGELHIPEERKFVL